MTSNRAYINRKVKTSDEEENKRETATAMNVNNIPLNDDAIWACRKFFADDFVIYFFCRR